MAIFSIFFNKFFKHSFHYRLSLLIFIFIFYLFLGSYFHLLLNAPVEYEERIKLADFLSNFYSNFSCVDKQKTEELFQLILQASNINGIDFSQNEQSNTSIDRQSWTFGGETIFFSFTLLSTIGYGYLTPSTNEGKLFCVLYIFFGVPLSFLVFYNVADRLELKCQSINKQENRAQESVTESIARKIYLKFTCSAFFYILIIYVLPSVFFSYLMEYPSWSFLDAVYFCYISISTVGFGDLIPGTGLSTFTRNNYRLGMTAYLFSGIVINIVIMNMFSNLPLVVRLNNYYVYKKNESYTQLSDDYDDYVINEYNASQTTRRQESVSNSMNDNENFSVKRDTKACSTMTLEVNQSPISQKTKIV